MNHFSRADAKYPVLWQGCVGAWAPVLGVSGSVLKDQSAFVKHGTLTNMDVESDWVISGGDYSLDFDGTDDHVKIPYRQTGGGIVSAMCWVRFGAAQSNKAFCGHYETPVNQRGWLLHTANTSWFGDGTPDGNELAVTVTSDGTLGATKHVIEWVNVNIADGVWHHVAFTFNRGDLRLYLDGIEKTTQVQQANASVVSMHLSTASLSIGALNVDSTPANFFTGQVDDVRVYNRHVQPQEVALLASRRGIAYDTRRKRHIGNAAEATGGRLVAGKLVNRGLLNSGRLV